MHSREAEAEKPYLKRKEEPLRLPMTLYFMLCYYNYEWDTKLNTFLKFSVDIDSAFSFSSSVGIGSNSQFLYPKKMDTFLQLGFDFASFSWYGAPNIIIIIMIKSYSIGIGATWIRIVCIRISPNENLVWGCLCCCDMIIKLVSCRHQDKIVGGRCDTLYEDMVLR